MKKENRLIIVKAGNKEYVIPLSYVPKGFSWRELE